MNEWMNELLSEWVNEWMNEWLNNIFCVSDDEETEEINGIEDHDQSSFLRESQCYFGAYVLIWSNPLEF